MFILAIIIGCFIGFGIACACVGVTVSHSNNLGDSKGSLNDFTQGSWKLLHSQDNIKNPKF